LACSCSRETTTEQQYNKYSLVFIGRVLEQTSYEEDGFQWVTFEVIDILKGQTTSIVKGKNLFTTCSLIFEQGQEWVIYTNPEYGRINDQYACGHSTILKSESGEDLLGVDGNLSKQEWVDELNFLKTRKMQKDRIVSFQLVRFMPLVLYTLLIIGFISLIFISEKIKLYQPSILPSAIVAGSLGAIFLYFILVPAVSEQDENIFFMAHLTVTSFLVLGNLLYKRWHKGNLTFLKSFILGYITYLIIVGVAFPLIIEHRTGFSGEKPDMLDGIPILLPVGIPFSGIVALFFSRAFNKLFKKQQPNIS
jgi:hypothetical protein